MPILSPFILQPPPPPILSYLTPSDPLQWLPRLCSCFILILVSPCILALSIQSVLAYRLVHPHFALLPVHPDILRHSTTWAIARCWWVYQLGGCVWAITGLGNAPILSDDLGRRLGRLASWTVEALSRIGGENHRGRLELWEEEITAVEDQVCVGVLKMQGVDTRPIAGFRLDHVPTSRPDLTAVEPPSPLSSLSQRSRRSQRAILFLAGGGYVTGFPLVHPFVFSLLKSFPPKAYSVLAPNIRRSLSYDRSFPVPLLDALAGWCRLRQTYEAEEIIVVGDSAGGGLGWSLVAYLAAVRERCGLGVPGGLVLISVG